MNLDPDLSPEELKIFLEETEEQIEMLDENIVKLEKEGDDLDLLQEIFRAAHTLKGSSAMVGHERMAELTHAMESLLDRLRSHTLSVNTEIIDALLYGLDAVKVLKEDITSPEESDFDIAPVVAAIQAITSDEAAAEVAAKAEITVDQVVRDDVQVALDAGQYVFQVEVSFDTKNDWASVRCLQVLTDLARMGNIVTSSPTAEEIDEDKVGFELKLLLSTQEDRDTIRGTVISIADVVGAEVSPFHPEEPESAAKENAGISLANRSQGQQSFQSVRIDVKVLDNLMNIVEELVIDRSRISRVGRLLQEKYRDDGLVRQLTQTSDHIIQIISELQENIMQVRMVPIGTIFSRFPRLVRDLAQSQQKKLDFTIEGEDTELDRSIIEQIRDPLIHILRNAVDHGIELPEQRSADGKPESATVQLKAFHEQGNIIITVEDDGRGIDTDRVRAAAVRKNVISAEAAEQLNATEATNLIFLPGMSTAEKTTEVSGRGVGLDIVHSNVEGLNGTVNLETTVGQGSKFTIRLPLTVAIMQGLLVSTSGVTYVLPLVSLVETLTVEPHEIQPIRGREVIRLRDKIIPLLRLNKVMGGSEAATGQSDQSLVVVVRAGDLLMGVIVDTLMERQEVVVKSMGEYLGDIEGIAGATILGDGQVALILDVASLARLLEQQASARVTSSDAAPGAADAELTEAATL